MDPVAASKPETWPLGPRARDLQRQASANLQDPAEPTFKILANREQATPPVPQPRRIN
jgi:hypothetical protein